MARDVEKVTIRDTRFIFRTNFSGKETKYNQIGAKEFNVVLPDDIAEDLKDRGWNVKQTTPREEGDPPVYHLPVRINFDSYYPPRVWLINADNGKRVMLDDDTVGQLDSLSSAEITKVNIVVNPSHYDNNGRKGIKAYCQNLMVYFLPDPFEAEYEAEFGNKSEEEDDIPFY